MHHRRPTRPSLVAALAQQQIPHATAMLDALDRVFAPAVRQLLPHDDDIALLISLARRVTNLFARKE